MDTQSKTGRCTVLHIFLCSDHGTKGAEAQISCQLGRVFPSEDAFKLSVIAASVVWPQSVVIILDLQEHCFCSFKFIEAIVLSNPAVVVRLLTPRNCHGVILLPKKHVAFS